MLNGDGDFDLLLSGRTGNAADTVNTSNDIGVGQGQNINGKDNNSDEEYLRIDFVKTGVATGNNMATTYTAAEHYAVKAFTFTTPQVQQGPATIFLQLFSVPTAQDNSSATANFGDNSLVGIQDVKVNGVSVAVVAVYEADGVTLKGYLVSGVDAGETIEVTGVSTYGRIVIGNLDGVTVNIGGANTLAVDGAKSFSVLAGSASVTTAETFKIRHDELAGVNDTPDPNDADDTGDVPPAIIDEVGALGYAKSSISALTLFNNLSVGADEDATYAFAITDAGGNPLVNVGSGLFTLNGIQIMLSTDGDGVLVGSAGLTEIFKVYVAPDGVVWIAQYEPIAHDVDGTSAAAVDDIATIAADLRVKAMITDYDGDFEQRGLGCRSQDRIPG